MQHYCIVYVQVAADLAMSCRPRDWGLHHTHNTGEGGVFVGCCARRSIAPQSPSALRRTAGARSAGARFHLDWCCLWVHSFGWRKIAGERWVGDCLSGWGEGCIEAVHSCVNSSTWPQPVQLCWLRVELLHVRTSSICCRLRALGMSCLLASMSSVDPNRRSSCNKPLSSSLQSPRRAKSAESTTQMSPSVFS